MRYLDIYSTYPSTRCEFNLPNCYQLDMSRKSGSHHIAGKNIYITKVSFHVIVVWVLIWREASSIGRHLQTLCFKPIPTPLSNFNKEFFLLLKSGRGSKFI